MFWLRKQTFLIISSSAILVILLDCEYFFNYDNFGWLQVLFQSALVPLFMIKRKNVEEVVIMLLRWMWGFFSMLHAFQLICHRLCEQPVLFLEQLENSPEEYGVLLLVATCLVPLMGCTSCFEWRPRWTGIIDQLLTVREIEEMWSSKIFNIYHNLHFSFPDSMNRKKFAVIYKNGRVLELNSAGSFSLDCAFTLDQINVGWLFAQVSSIGKCISGTNTLYPNIL